MTAGVTNKPGYARLTLTVDGDDKALNQIQKQIKYLIILHFYWPALILEI